MTSKREYAENIRKKRMAEDPDATPDWRDRLSEPYKQRTLLSFFWFVLIVAFIGFLIWYSFPQFQTDMKTEPDTLATSQRFGVIRDGRIRPVQTLVSEGYVRADELAEIMPAAGADAADQDLLRGGVYDYDGRLVGYVDSLIYDQNRIKRMNFILADELTPWEQGQSISVPIDEVVVSWDERGYSVHLNRNQTAGLAEALFGPP